MRHAPTRSAAAIGRKKVTAEFRPLDGDIVNEAIPAFFIGRNMEGFWVARDAKGQAGGIFLLENSALSFARRNCQPAGCATVYPSERFELDLKNMGNPLVAQLSWLKRFAMRGRQRWATFICNMAEAVKGFLDMTMLMHTRGPLELATCSSQKARYVAARLAAALAIIKRLCFGGLMVLAAGGALAAIIALKAAIFFWVFHYY